MGARLPMLKDVGAHSIKPVALQSPFLLRRPRNLQGRCKSI